ncbi:MAG: CRISPR-associated protein Csx11 [Clostridia bacterium]|nr:CRISPR-associated protein Csx11 [Clostridia bacterium]
MSSMLEKLEKNRLPILLAEIGAYLHLIGRFSEEFIAANTEDYSVNYSYKNICENDAFFERTQLGGLLKCSCWKVLLNSFDYANIKDSENLKKNEVECFCEFIKKHIWTEDEKNDPQGLCRVLADAHGIVSGIDKGVAGLNRQTGKQRQNCTFKSTAFGYETVIELLGTSRLSDVEESRIKEKKNKFFESIEKILKDILGKNEESKSIITADKKSHKEFITYERYKQFIGLIKEYYPLTLGETRRPINEITLYDYAHPIASLVKSNLAKIIIDGWYDPKGKSEWRILKINIDVLGLLSKGLKIGDILGYKNELEKVYDKIKEVIEFEYPLGNEIYRDTTGIYFSCPAVDDVDNFKSEITKKIQFLKELVHIDYSFQIGISDKSRSGVILAREIGESLKKIYYHHEGDVENLKKMLEKSQKRGEDVCPICRIGLKPENEDRCGRCKERYNKRAKNWLGINENQEEKNDRASKETIWLDEIADKNDRVALIIGQFDLRNWLSGAFVGTLVSQTFNDWKNLSYVKKNLQSLKISDITDLEKGYLKLFYKYEKNKNQALDGNWKKICASFIGKRPENFITDFWDPIKQRDSTEKALTQVDNEDKARHLIRLLFRKHPSFARIFRIWETTQEFIEKTIFKEILRNYDWNSELRKQRIQFKIEPNPELNEGSTCDVEIDGIKFCPVCVSEKGGIFVSTINLELLKKFGESLAAISMDINEKEVKLKIEGDKTWRTAKNGKSFRITEVKVAEENYRYYLPFTEIYDFPDQFMVLVPAYEALNITEKIFDKYEKQFAKVRDRLPFHLGIIAFHRRTPLYVVMDAGRRLLDAFRRETKTIEADVINVSNDDSRKVVELEINAKNYALYPFKWEVSYGTGDSQKDDNWYPYFRNKSSNYSRPLSFDYTGKGNFVTHVKNIKKDDQIEIETSYFKMIYLEHAADRYKVGEILRPLHDIKRLQELWQEIKTRLKSKTWSTSQIYAFRDEIKRRKDYGSEYFWKFIKANMINVLGLSPQKDKELFDKLKQALDLEDELLDLCLYWNLQVRKDK